MSDDDSAIIATISPDGEDVGVCVRLGLLDGQTDHERSQTAARLLRQLAEQLDVDAEAYESED